MPSSPSLIDTIEINGVSVPGNGFRLSLRRLDYDGVGCDYDWRVDLAGGTGFSGTLRLEGEKCRDIFIAASRIYVRARDNQRELATMTQHQHETVN